IQTAISPYATIQQVALSKNHNAKTVLLMQDAHLHFEAQTNIAGAIHALTEKNPSHSKLLVGLEGARKGPINLSAYRAMPDQDLVRRIAEGLLKAKVINGGEYAGIGFGGFDLNGVEDQAEYNAHVKV